MQTLCFDNTFVRELPIDPQDGSRRRQVHGALHSRVEPTPVCAPRLIAHSREVASLLGIDAADVAYRPGPVMSEYDRIVRTLNGYLL